MTEVLVSRTGVWRDAALVLGGSLLTASAAQISIPLYGQGVAHPVAALIGGLYGTLSMPLPTTPVPITGQTFAVLLIGALLGGRLGFLSLMAYLAEGVAGLPVFALGKHAWSATTLSGVPWVAGPTAGYLLSLPLAASIVGWLSERGWDRRPTTMAVAMVAGDAVVFLFGLLWLGQFVGAQNAVPMGLLPFIPGEVVKVVLAALVLPAGWAASPRSAPSSSSSNVSRRANKPQFVDPSG